MKEIKLDHARPETTWEAIEAARRTLTDGGVVVCPTETIYGLLANALDEKAIAKIFRIKGRSAQKPVSILVRDLAMARRMACIDSKAEAILRQLWPGPVTVILRKKDAIPYSLTGGTENVAVRISDHPFVRELLKDFAFPVTATSANLSGEKNLLSSEEIRKTFSRRKDAPDLFIDGGDLESGTPSTILDLTDIRNPRLVRMGMVGKGELESFLNKFIN